MDPNNFDELTRSLAVGRSRRSVLRGLVGGGAALVAMRAGVPVAAQEGKVSICHYPPGNPENVQILSVSANAVDAHVANHGDTVLGSVDSCTDCGDVCEEVDSCTPAECTDDGCNTASSCVATEPCTTATCTDGDCDISSNCGGGQYCSGFGCCDDIDLDGEEGCFWMENFSGLFCWIPTGDSFGDCRALDSCSDTGGGQSGGGCYKWATSSSDPGSAPPWA